MADLGLKGHGPVSHLILTHAHFDHIGGTAAVRGPDTQVIASAGFPAEAERQRHWRVSRYLTGTGASPSSDVKPDRLISERTSLVVGDTEFTLIPVRGGETPDALMVHLPASGLLFTGDVMMPYVSRDDFIARLYHQRTGYWQPVGEGLDPRSQEERAAALDLLAGGKADAFAYAAANLADQGDLALALDIVTPGLLRHPTAAS